MIHGVINVLIIIIINRARRDLIRYHSLLFKLDLTISRKPLEPVNVQKDSLHPLHSKNVIPRFSAFSY